MPGVSSMAIVNLKKREIECKIVYYGPGRCGKTTNLDYIFKAYNKQVSGEMVSINTDGDRTLFERKIDLLPDILCNSGGVIVSYFEWLQNKRSEFWMLDEVDTKLHRLMVSAYQRVRDTAQAFDTDWRTVSVAVLPSRMATTRFTWRAMPGSWLTISVVRPYSRLRCLNVSYMTNAVAESTSPVGSSANSSLGSLASKASITEVISRSEANGPFLTCASTPFLSMM
mgnify:CR=1 FL=1